MPYFVYFLATFVLSIILTLFVKRLSWRFKIIDFPDGGRKLHPKPLPLLGGVAIFISFWLVSLYLLTNPILGIQLLGGKLIAIFVASTIVVMVGVADEIKPLAAKWRLLLTALACLVAIVWGLGLERINNPFGSTLELGLVVGNIIVFFWLMGIMHTTKILDGLDGLSAGIVTIGALIIFFFTQTTAFFQPNVALLSIIFAGACLGFLVFNFYPAKIFLGESGSLFVGFILAALAVISGGKLAIAALVLAVPILDLARVIYLRIIRKQPIWQGDREHLHFKLLDSGFSVRKSVLILYAISAALGVVTLFLQSVQKVVFSTLIILVMLIFSWSLNKKRI